MLALDVVILVTMAGLYPTLVATAFGAEFARLRGQPVELARLLTVVLLIQVTWLILFIALLTLPAAMP